MADSGYSARQLTVLEGLEAVRKRPGMYIGSTDSRGLMHCLWEIIDNSVDEALSGYGEAIEVTLNADGSVTVSDSGRGIPVDVEPRSGLTGVELVFTKLHAGGKFGGSSYASSGGLHGVGASVVNALSARLDVEVDRDGETRGMSFRHGEPGVFEGEGPDAAFTPFHDIPELTHIKKIKKSQTGTRVRYWADPQIFLQSAHFDSESLIARARQTAFLVPGLKLAINDRRDSERNGPDGERHEFQYVGGISEFVDYLALDGPITDTWRISAGGDFSERVPVLDEESGHMVSRDVSRHCDVDIALRWGSGYDTRIETFVNIIATPKGGTHLAGFEQGLLRFFRKQIEDNARKLKAGKDKPDKDDILAGLTAVVTVRLPEPQFEGQTKEVLGTAAVRSIVSKALSAGLEEKFASKSRTDRAQTAQLLEKMVSEMKSRIALRAQRDTARRKNTLENSSLPAKLIDCRSKDVDSTELFIVEGDSALGTARPARDSEYQALLPIRGKILNVQKASLAEMLNNAECGAIIKVIGAGSGRDFDLSMSRYGKVILMTDADVDGAHIRILLLTLFFRYMRPMLEQGRVYAAVPPLHRVVIKHSGRKPNEVVYTYSEKELHSLLASLSRRGKKYVEPIQRYKGLGEMDADQLAETTMDRQQRTLRRVRMEDAQMAAQTFELLMGGVVAPRKEFLSQNADDVDRERIDA
jgi:DNA gyrase subunit B